MPLLAASGVSLIFSVSRKSFTGVLFLRNSLFFSPVLLSPTISPFSTRNTSARPSQLERSLPLKNAAEGLAASSAARAGFTVTASATHDSTTAAAATNGARPAERVEQRRRRR